MFKIYKITGVVTLTTQYGDALDLYKVESTIGLDHVATPQECEGYLRVAALAEISARDSSLSESIRIGAVELEVSQVVTEILGELN